MPLIYSLILASESPNPKERRKGEGDFSFLGVQAAATLREMGKNKKNNCVYITGFPAGAHAGSKAVNYLSGALQMPNNSGESH